MNVETARNRFVDALARAFAEGTAHLRNGGEITQSIWDLVVAADNLVEALDDDG